MQDTELNKDLQPKKGIYLLPNLFTTSGLFAGFYSIVAAMRGDFEYAAIAVLIAMIMDGLDGRVARLTNTQSTFGAEYDSLADIVSFGIAPALVIYSCTLVTLGKPGWLIAFFFTATCALRLARFNSKAKVSDEDELIQIDDKKYFQGLPCPSAAGLIASLVWVIEDNQLGFENLAIMFGVITVLSGIFMVSNIKYYSFKELDLKGKVPFIAVLAVLLLLVCISIDPPQVLLLAFSAYVLSGPLLFLKNIKK